MFEQLLIDLFCKYSPEADGTLDRASLHEMNVKLSQWYCKTAAEMGSLDAPPPEPLPMDAVRFPAFRQNMCRMLSGLNLTPQEKEKFITELLLQPREAPRKEMAGAGVLFSDNRSPFEARPVPRLEDASGSPQAQCWQPTAAELSAWVKEASGQDLSEIRERVLAAGKAASFSAMALTKDVVHSANDVGLRALEVTRAYSQHLKEYGEQVLASEFNPSRKPSPSCSKLPASMPAPDYDSDVCIGDSLLGTYQLPDSGLAQRQHRSASPARPPLLPEGAVQPPASRPREASPDARARAARAAVSAHPSPVRPQPAMEPQSPSRLWRFDAGDGLHVDIRTTPDINGPRSGKWINPGEVFEVSRELQESRDGVVYLQLADGRGWIFDRKPGVGFMCRRQ